MDDMDEFRSYVANLLDWHDAHATFDDAVKGVPFDLQDKVPDGFPYSLWQLLEHIRLAQYDILDFCRNPSYKELAWPGDYWPKSPAPPLSSSWKDSVAATRRDTEELKQLAMNRSVNLLDRVPAGTGQTFLRELLLVADHTAYHVGQMVLVRRMLGIWKP